MKRRRAKAKLADLLAQAEQAEAELAANLARSNALGEEHKKLVSERAGAPTAVKLLEIEHRQQQIRREYERLDTEAQHLGAEAIRARTAYSQAARRVREAQETLERLEDTPERFERYSRWQRHDLEQRCRDLVRELV